MSRQPEHYLLKSQATRPSDVLHREESDNTGRRVLSLSPVGASLFNARWLPSSAKTLFTLVKVPSPERICCSEPWNESLNVLLSMLCVNAQKYWIITHAKEFRTMGNIYSHITAPFLFFFFNLSYISLSCIFTRSHT